MGLWSRLKAYKFHVIEAQSGFILGLVLIFFVIFTILGIGFVQLGGSDRYQTQKHYQKLRAFYHAEGGIQKALWLLNRVSTAKASYSDKSVSVVFDPTTKKLTATGKAGSAQSSILVTLEQDHPFRHIVSYQSSFKFDKSKTSISHISGAEPKKTSQFPLPDLNYYQSIADTFIDPGKKGEAKLSGNKLNGIIYVKGKVKIKKSTVIHGTLVATSKITFEGTCEIYAQKVSSSSSSSVYYPAIICAASIDFKKSKSHIIHGAIYASEDLKADGGFYTGPAIANNVQFKKNSTLSDSNSNKYYGQPPGFIYPFKSKGAWRIKSGSWQII